MLPTLTDADGKPKGGVVCKRHKTADMTNLTAKRCVYHGCNRSPQYGYASDGKRIYCSDHAEKGMINVKRKKCSIEECTVTANYGFGRSYTHCAKHKQEGMSLVATFAKRTREEVTACAPPVVSVVATSAAASLSTSTGERATAGACDEERREVRMTPEPVATLSAPAAMPLGGGGASSSGKVGGGGGGSGSSRWPGGGVTEEGTNSVSNLCLLANACLVAGEAASGDGRSSGSVSGRGKQHQLRRSTRVPGSSALNTPCVVDLIHKIRTNDAAVEVLKLHNFIGPDESTVVIDAVLEALMSNNNCQALYIQNFSKGFRDEQVSKLAAVLRRGNIWCLNAGENDRVSRSTWRSFVEEIDKTNVTVSARNRLSVRLSLCACVVLMAAAMNSPADALLCLPSSSVQHVYLSEHFITDELKKAMQNAIRDNRAKHTRHKTASNFEVIRQCTNMW